MKRTFSLCSTLVALLFCINSEAASISVNIDRDPVGLNESFMMTFESDSSVDGAPDFSPLNKNFQVLSKNSSSNMSIINGKISTSKKWQLTVLARRAGKLLIPAIHFGKDTSQVAFVNITRGRSSTSRPKSDQDIFIEVAAEPLTPYVQSEVIYTVRLFLAVATANASLSEPGISGTNAVIERLGEDKNFQTNRGGRRYNVVERRYAIYPQVSGSMTIEPVMFQGQINRNGFSLFDPFGPQPKTIIRRSIPLTLDVKTVPEQFPGGYWIPAKNISLTETWSQDPPKFQVGEPLTRTLTLVAQGQTASQLLELPEWIPDAFKQYPDQATLHDEKNANGITATRQEKVAIIPNRAGEYVLPEIVVPWWNTSTNKLEYARIAERKITVAAVAGDNAMTMTDLPTLDDENLVLAQDNNDISDSELALTEANANQAGGFWQGLSASLALAWIITLFLWWRSRSKKNNDVKEDHGARRLKQAFREVERACAQGEPNKVKQALLLWGQRYWPDSPPTSLGEIGRRNPGPLAEKIMALNDNLYSQQKEPWDGKAFLQVLKTSLASSARRDEQQQGELEPLYRI